MIRALLIVVGVVGLVWSLSIASCYPRPPVDPPSCAQDPSQPWCLPPAFAARDAGADRGAK